MRPYQSYLKKCIVTLAVSSILAASPLMASNKQHNIQFKRIASFPAFKNYSIETESVAEIVAASKDGMTLLYTDSENESVGFIDIRNPRKPAALGAVPMTGEPTSVAVSGNYALVAVNTSADFINPGGHLAVVNIVTQSIVATHDLGGQPDSVAVSPDGRFAAIAIENERNEEWCVVPGEGLGNDFPVPEDDEAAEAACDASGGEVSGLPQQPGGKLVIVDLVGTPKDWGLRDVSLTGLNGMLYPNDPEPEYVDINRKNIAVVTLQENNHIALVNLAKGKVIKHFSAGTTNLDQIDIEEDELITLNGTLKDVAREPDGVSWISNTSFATADEGDLNGGSRGFTIFRKNGKVTYASGNNVEHSVVRHGHFPDDRAENKGNEPENVEVGKYGKDKLLFVGSERSSAVLVYQVKKNSTTNPTLLQVLPTMVKPEGLLAIPQRGLFVVASEEDARDDKVRAGLTIFKRASKANYPTIISRDRADGTPIPWSALSGLAIDNGNQNIAYTIQDSFYKKSRILKMNINKRPAIIKDEIVLKDIDNRIPVMPVDVVNDDNTVNLDPEGIATRVDGGFWIASEGRGTIGDPKRPVETLNLLLRVDDSGNIEEVVTLPDSVNDRQVRFGFEGVAAVGSGSNEVIYVAFQREWAGDPDGHVRIGRYNTSSGEWSFFYYPIEAPLSANGGWVGLSDLSYLGDNRFAVIERDNQGGPDAVIKRLYTFSVDGLTPKADSSSPDFPVVSKALTRDLVPDLQATGGLILEKIEGLAVNDDGDTFIVNDNDGVDDSNGETQLLRFRELFDKD